MKQILIAVIGLLILGAGVWWFTQSGTTDYEQNEPETTEQTDEDATSVEPDEGIGDGAEPLEASAPEPIETIGESVNGTAITAHHFGAGDTEVLLVGGVHGSYSPNTEALAEELISYYETNETAIPDGVMLTIIPNLNPDGLAAGGTEGRFNANDVDLNRNFDCEWSATGMWRDREVSGGSAPFSEPEAAALRDYVLENDPEAAVVWFSQEGKVYPSACGGSPSASSMALANSFATAAGYPSDVEFDAYAITGDMVNWMAKEGISAISVLLTNHQDTERTQNLAGVEAILNAYAN